MDTVKIHLADRMSSGMIRYWSCLAKRLVGHVTLIDPYRTPLHILRKEYSKGTKVYRASTGGKWGKSKEIVTL